MTEIEVVAIVAKHEGVDCVVRVLEAGGHRFVDVRDRIEVDGEVQWGRGYLIPLTDPHTARDIGQAVMLGGVRAGA